MSERELKAPVECAGLESPHPVPADNLMEEYHRLVADKNTTVNDRGIQKGDGYDLHMLIYHSSDESEVLSVQMLQDPKTGKQLLWSIGSQGRGDRFDLTTGGRDEAYWSVDDKYGRTDVIAMIDDRSGAVLTEGGSFHDYSGHPISQFIYGFNPDGNAIACFKADAQLSYPNPIKWQKVWSAKPEYNLTP